MSAPTWDDLMFEAWKLATDQPDHVDPNGGTGTCFYSADKNGGGCIIGQALTNLEVDREVLAFLDDDAVAVSQEPFRVNVGLEEFSEDSASPPFLSRLQADQDDGMSWGEAWASAVHTHPKTWREHIMPRVKAWKASQ